MLTTGDFRLLHSASMICLFIMLHSQSFSQLRPRPTLSLVEEFSSPTDLRQAQFFTFSNSRSRDLLYYSNNTFVISVAVNKGDGTFQQAKILDTLNCTSMVAGNLNNDGIDDIVVVQRENNKIVVYLSTVKDTSYTKKIFPVSFYPERVIIADISGDQINDIIVYGKLSTGVTVFRGTRTGTFREPKILFTSFPVSSLAVIRLNGDDIPDVVVRNWLKNEDVFYFGVGNLRFSEQSALSYGTDSVASLFADVNNDGITDAIVASAQYQSLLVYHSDGLGNFQRMQSLPLLQPAAMLFTASFSHSSAIDIVLVGESGKQFSLYLNRGNGSFFDEIVFGIPYRRSRLIYGDINADGYPDMMCIDADTSRYTVYWNAQTTFTRSIEPLFAVGNSPNNLFASDINADGYDDLLISNGGSNTISVIYGSPRLSSSQLSIETPDEPSSVSVYAKSDSSLTLITAHSHDSKIGITTLSASSDTSTSLIGEVESYTIALTGKPSHVLPDLSPHTTMLSLYVFLRSQTNSIVFYQQLQGATFVVKSLTPLIPSRILFATISDVNNDGYTDLVYLYNDKRTNADILGVTLNDVKSEFTGTTYSITLPDTGNRRSFLLIEDLNSDQQKDYLVYSAASRQLYFIAAKKNGEFSTLVSIADNITLTHQELLQVYDVDADGVLDIVYFDSVTKTINVLRNKGNGTFYPSRRLLSRQQETAFTCGDFNGDGVMDIALLQPNRQAVEIQYGKSY